MKSHVYQSRHGGMNVRIPTPSILMAMLLVLSAPAWAEDFAVSPGLSAYWYNPARSGEGFVLEILDEDSAVLYWFTYDEEGDQRWLIDVGDIEGSEIIFPELTVTSGAIFGQEFDPDDVDAQVVGSATLDFLSCDSAEWSFSAFGQSQSYEVTRLSETMGASCGSPNGVPGASIFEYAGQSGSFYDPSHAGEGYILQWLSRNAAQLVWFSYDSEGNQYWMIGTGSREGDTIEFPSLQATTGGRFGEDFEAGSVESFEWGSLQLKIDCSGGLATYQSDLPGFGAGELMLSRLSAIAQVPCPWERPELTDLYNLSTSEINFRPLADDSTSALDDLNINVHDISNNGTVVGLRHGSEANDLIRWSPDFKSVLVVPQEPGGVEVRISSNGETSVSTRPINVSSGDLQTEPIVLESNSEEWIPLEDFTFSKSLVIGMSGSAEFLVGTADDNSDNRIAWVWEAGIGQSVLSKSTGMQSAQPYSVSEGGGKVVGRQGAGSGFSSEEYATRWLYGEPRLLRDEAGTPLGFALTCNEACDVVPGSMHGGEVNTMAPGAYSLWLWTERFGHQYLDGPESSLDSLFPPSKLALDSSSDGSMFVGRFLTRKNGNVVQRPLVWTQKTGVVELAELLISTPGWDDNWEDMSAVAISPDGSKILIAGAYRDEPELTLGRYARGVVVYLEEIE